MAYKTFNVPDEEMLIWTEKTLDDKFKPEATWTTSFLQDEKMTEIMNIGGRELKEGILKIKTKKGFATLIPFLWYAKSKFIKKFLEECEGNELRTVNSLHIVSSFDDLKKFYECRNCNGYIEGIPVEEREFMGYSPLPKT